MKYNNPQDPHKRENPAPSKRWQSLRVKLVFSHLIVIFVAMAVTAFLLLSLVRGYFLAALEQSLTAQAHLIAQAIIPGATVALPQPTFAPAYNTVQQQQIGNLSVQVANRAPPEDPETVPYLRDSNLPHLYETSVELSAALDTRIRILDDKGVILVDSSGLEEGLDLSDESSVVTALSGEQQSQLFEMNGEEVLNVSVPVLVEGQVAGVIFLSQPLRDVAAVLSDIRTRLLMAFALAIPLSALIGLALARTIARPVRALTVAAGRLSNGDFDFPLQTTGQDELGHLSRTFATMRDRLQSVERMRTQFVSDVSHELRTPLTAIKGLAETLRAGAADDSTVRDRFLTSVEDETDRLIRLVNDLLVLSRVDGRALKLSHQSIELHALVHATIEKLIPQAESLGVDLDLEFDNTSLTLFADPDRVEQILFILLDNALKHTPAGGRVKVIGYQIRVDGSRVRYQTQNSVDYSPTLEPSTLIPHPEGPWAIIHVADTGEGIPPRDLPYVFERFYRADHSRSRDKGGSGLGLSIAKALVEAHGGLIWLESPSSILIARNGNPGTTASFSLPIVEE
jgi:signal transduction histidine kinase